MGWNHQLDLHSHRSCFFSHQSWFLNASPWVDLWLIYVYVFPEVKICEVGGKGILLPLFGEAEQVGKHRKTDGCEKFGMWEVDSWGFIPKNGGFVFFFLVGVACNWGVVAGFVWGKNRANSRWNGETCFFMLKLFETCVFLCFFLGWGSKKIQKVWSRAPGSSDHNDIFWRFEWFLKVRVQKHASFFCLNDPCSKICSLGAGKDVGLCGNMLSGKNGW